MKKKSKWYFKLLIAWNEVRVSFFVVGFIMLVGWGFLTYTDEFESITGFEEYSRTNIPRFFEIEDQGSLISNKKECARLADEWKDNYNARHMFSKLRWEGEIEVTCEEGRCLCE